MTSTKPDVLPSAPNPAPNFSSDAVGTRVASGPAAPEQGSKPAERQDRDGNRIILYERLTGDAARKRAMGPEPHGAGMPPETVQNVEYVEVWSTPASADGYDFRMYSFGGALIACRSTRSH